MTNEKRTRSRTGKSSSSRDPIWTSVAGDPRVIRQRESVSSKILQKGSCLLIQNNLEKSRLKAKSGLKTDDKIELFSG